MLSIEQLRKWAKQQLLQLTIPCSQQVYLPEPIAWEEFFDLADDFALHSIAALINDWYEQEMDSKYADQTGDSKDFGKPLNAHCKDILGGDEESSERMLKRVSKRLRDINAQYRKTSREMNYPVPDIYEPTSKREGIPISNANMQTIKNFSSLGTPQRLLKAITSGHIKSSKSVSNSDFADYFTDYEHFIAEINFNIGDVKYLSCALDFYRMQRKFHIDLISEIACYMDNHNIKKFPTEHSHLFWSTLNTGDRLIEANQVLTFNHVIPIVFSRNINYIAKESVKWEIMRLAQSELGNIERDAGLYSELTIPFAANFFRKHYNMFKQRAATDFGTLKNPNNQRIRLARQIMNAVYTRSE